MTWNKDHNDTVTKPIVCNNYSIENYYKMPTAESTENWWVDGLINFEEPFSGLEELSFIIVWKPTTCKKCEIEIF